MLPRTLGVEAHLYLRRGKRSDWMPSWKTVSPSAIQSQTLSTPFNSRTPSFHAQPSRHIQSQELSHFQLDLFPENEPGLNNKFDTSSLIESGGSFSELNMNTDLSSFSKASDSARQRSAHSVKNLQNNHTSLLNKGLVPPRQSNSAKPLSWSSQPNQSSQSSRCSQPSWSSPLNHLV